MFRIASQTRQSAFTTTPRVVQSSQLIRIPYFARHTFSNTPTFNVESRSIQESTKGTPCEDNTKETDHKENVEGLKQKQTQAPWHREGSDVPPAHRQRSAGAMVKGKLLSTPSRLLKLTLRKYDNENNTILWVS